MRATALSTLRRFLTRRCARITLDDGATTAEYAIVIGAAVGFAGLLVVILRSGEVQAILTQLVTSSLGAAG